MRLTAVKTQTNVVGQSAEGVTLARVVNEFIAHDYGIDHFKQVGRCAFPGVTCRWREGKNCKNLALHGFKHTFFFVHFTVFFLMQ